MEFNTHHTESCMGWPWLVFFDTGTESEDFLSLLSGYPNSFQNNVRFLLPRKKEIKKKGKKKIMKKVKPIRSR